MIDKVANGINLALDKLAAVPAGWWFVIGFVIASIPITIKITSKVKLRHLKKKGEKLASHFIVLNVAFWGFLLSVADFIVAQAANIVPLGNLFPFIGQVWPTVSMAAITTHAVATAMKAWWTDRKNKKKINVTEEDIEKFNRQLNPNGAVPAQPQPLAPRSENLFS